MSKVSYFMKQNKKLRENATYAPTASLCDENGEPIKWELQPIKTAVDDVLRDECTVNTQHPSNPNIYIPQLQTKKYQAKLIAASVVFPNLHDAELQDSYGVYTPEDLVREMVDSPGEWQDFVVFVQEFNGFNVSMKEKVEEAKN
jgi:hypothetical protein